MLRILFVSACLVASNLAAGAYLTMTSLTTLTPATSKGSAIKFDSIDAIKGFDVSPGKDKVIIKESGVYLIIVSAQVGASSSAASPGYVDVWFPQTGNSSLTQQPEPRSKIRRRPSPSSQRRSRNLKRATFLKTFFQQAPPPSAASSFNPTMSLLAPAMNS